jgi:hypothetical protein
VIEAYLQCDHTRSTAAPAATTAAVNSDATTAAAGKVRKEGTKGECLVAKAGQVMIDRSNMRDCSYPVSLRSADATRRKSFSDRKPTSSASYRSKHKRMRCRGAPSHNM